MRPNISLVASVSTAAVLGSVLLSAMSPTPAFACPFSKSKDTTLVNSGDSPNSGSTSKVLDFNKMGIAGAGIAGVAGIFAAGMVYRARRSRLADAAIADVPSEEVPYVSHPEEAVSTSTPDKDLTLVG